MTNTPIGFWSYSHTDNEGSSGEILELARRIGGEYSLITGTDLQCFVDRSDIKWGQLWRTRIDSALVETTFLIPILTPRYFQRPECRKEFREFTANAKALGVEEYVLPILYVPVRDFNSENSDEVVAMAATIQYFDWTQLRVAAADSTQYRQALRALAERLAEIADHVSSRRLVSPSTPMVDDPPRLLDALQLVNDRWPALIELIEADRKDEALYTALWDSTHARMNRLRANGRSGSVPVMVNKLATELMPYGKSHFNLARTYSSMTAELDPVVTSLFRRSEISTSLSPKLIELQVDIQDIQGRIEDAQSKEHQMEVWLSEYSEQSRAMQALRELYESSAAYVNEGNATIARWVEISRRELP